MQCQTPMAGIHDFMQCGTLEIIHFAPVDGYMSSGQIVAISGFVHNILQDG